MLTPDEGAFVDEMRAYLAERGLAVIAADELAGLQARKPTARRTRATSTDARADGCTPARKSGKAHGHCSAHWRTPGGMVVCVAQSQDENGGAIGAAWSDTDTVLSFALDCEARLGDAGRVLKAEHARLAAERHAEHRASAARFTPGSMAGMSANEVASDGTTRAARYIGAPDCAACWREYRADEWQAMLGHREAGATSYPPTACRHDPPCSSGMRERMAA